MPEKGTVEYMQALLLKNEFALGKLTKTEGGITDMLIHERKRFRKDIKKEIQRLKSLL